MPGGDDPVGQGGVTRDLPVLPRRQLRRRDLVGGRERLGSLAVVPARPQRQYIGLGDVRLAAELLPDECFAHLGGTAVHPADQTQGEHVLRALTVLLGRSDRLHGAQGQRRHRHRVHDVVGKFPGFQRVGRIVDLGQVALGELIGVGDHRAAAGQILQVCFQRGRIHRDQDVRAVARGENVVVGDLNLE